MDLHIVANIPTSHVFRIVAASPCNDAVGEVVHSVGFGVVRGTSLSSSKTIFVIGGVALLSLSAPGCSSYDATLLSFNHEIVLALENGVNKVSLQLRLVFFILNVSQASLPQLANGLACLGQK